MPQGWARQSGLGSGVAPVGVLPGNGSWLLQVIAEARRLGFYSVRGNHDDKALAAYEAFKANKPVPAKTRWAQALPSLLSTRLEPVLSREGIIIGHAGWLAWLEVCQLAFNLRHMLAFNLVLSEHLPNLRVFNPSLALSNCRKWLQQCRGSGSLAAHLCQN